MDRCREARWREARWREEDEWRGKTILVTGGGTGIGRAIAQAFASRGAQVIVAGPPGSCAPESGIQTRDLDVSSQAEADTLIGQLTTLDVLVNCAGIIRRDEEYEMPTFLRVLDINLSGVMRMCTGCKPLLAQSRGSIVNIASVLSFFGGARVPAYSASKGGIVQLTRSLAAAWAQDGIRVNAVAPGWIATPLTQAIQDDGQRSAAILARTPMGRWGQPEDVAGPVLFLCSQAAAFVTGAVLPVDGGYLIS
jgi:NAD(P)-dependent dehydrogenase (short-subunit alcohol dehydrogenase family)